MPKDSSLIITGMGVAMGLITDLVSAVKEQGGSDDDIHRLVKPEGRKILSRMASIIVEAGKSSRILELIGVVTISAISRFVASKKFVIARKPINIAWLGDNFKSWFLKKIEEPVGKADLRYMKLTSPSVDGPILAELGEDRAETTLAQIFSLMERQPNGEKGILLTNGYANIFYVRDVSGILRAVHVRWCSDGWSVRASSVENPIWWLVGDRVFSRNS
ncbi:MAG: hypothetical protein FJZ05_00415 [Candidatus Nealsonbacteria bacterium]|nr:hypothetical protein [Candidatus Nealsonbacteria bacterium]